MDLVKIGFQINANGLKDANTEVDKLLGKVDNIGTKGKKASSEFENSQKKVQDSVKKTEKVSTSASDKMIQKQQTINQLLPHMDKNTANLASSFWLVSKEAQSFNKFLDIMGEQDAIVKQKKQTEALVKEQQKQTKAVQSTIAQYEGLSNKSLGGGILDSIEQQNKGIEELRQQYQAEEKEANKKAESVIKAQEKQAKAVQDTVAQYENLSNKSLGNGVLDQIEQQNKGLEELKKQYKDQEKEQQKALDDIETARQKHFSEVQKDYEKQQQAIVDTQQKAIDKQVKAQNTLNESNQKAITLEQAKAKYVSQGYGKTDSTRLARLEVSGADVATLNNYKSAIEATTRATQALNPTLEKATTSHSNFLAQVKGIAIYAALSAAIYGVMTAMTSLAVSTVKMADEYTAIQNRMKLYITDAKELGKVNNQLAQFSMQNNVGLRETATLFSRLAPSMQKIGANTAAITSVVDAFGKSMRIGGATAMEAASATIQFSQAMASGKLSGDEFKSISEASPRFLKAIADGSDIAADKLKEMSAAGMLTTEVISKALLKEYPKLIEENKKLGITLEQGANAIKTGFLVAIGEFNEGAKITEALGESMLDLAQSMFTFAQTAKKTGADVKKWFEENANTIQTVVEVIKLLAVTIVSKYVASMIVAGAISLKTAYSLNVASLGATAVQRAFGLAAIAAIRLGGALSALATPKNLFTLGLTVVGVAASYLLMRDNAAEATQKLVEQSKYVDITTEAYQRLNKEQQLNARSSIVNDLNDTNKKLDEQAAAVENVLKSYAMSRQFSGLGLDKGTKEIINGVTKGVLSYDTALRLLSENKSIPKNIVEDFKKEKEIYDETAKSAVKFADAAKVVGASSELAGNQAQNATPAVQGMKNAVTGLGDEASITGLKVQAFGKSMQDLVGTYTNLLRLRKATGLNETFGTKALEEGQSQAAKNESIVKANKAVALAQEAIIRDKLKGLDVSKEQLQLDKVREGLGKKQENLTFAYAKQVAPLAKAAQDAQEANSEYTSSLKKQGKEQEKVSKEADKIVDKYESQEAVALRLTQYLRQGVAYSVAKVASEGKYAKVYGDNLETARKIAKARQEAADIEESSKGREDSQNSLMKQFRDQQAISDFMKEGYSYAVAQATVQSGFAVNAGGIANANNRTLISLREQLSISVAEASYQKDLLDFVKSGLSVEEASAKVAIYRNKHLNQSLIITAEELAKAKQTEQVTKSQIALEQESNSYKEQATYLVQTTKNELADIMDKHKGVLLQEAQTLQTRKDIVEKLREYNDLLEKQKSLSGVLDSTNFEVFGDFGNPFKSALEGLNSLLFGMSDLEAKYQRMGADLTARIDKEEKGSEAQKLLIAEKANLELMHIQESKQARDKAITSGLSLTKSMFKEESKGYKIVSGMEKAYQAGKIAFQMWKNREKIKETALELWGYAKSAASYVATTATKVAAEGGLNIVKGIGAILSGAQQAGPLAFVGFAAMAALVAGLGVSIAGGGLGSSSSGTVTPANDGTGTVFGDSTAKSESINNSIEILSENSDLMLPLTSAMLRSLRNIESSLGGVANLIIRGDVGNIASGLEFDAKFTGTLGKFDKLVNGVESFVDKISIGKILGFNIREVVSGLGSTILGGLFGKTSAEVTGSGLFGGSQSLGNVLDGGFNLSQYADVTTTKKSWFSKKTSYSTQYQAASKELSDQFGLIFTNVYDSILSASSVLGRDENGVIQKLRDSIINIGKIDTKGKTGEEIQEALESVVGQQSDLIAKGAVGGLDDFQKVGEGYFETLMRVATGIETASYYTEKLNVQAIKYTDIINKQGDVAAEMVRQSVLLVEGNKNIKGGLYDLVNNFEGTAEELTDFVLTLRDLQDQLFMTGKNADYLTSSMILGAGGLDKLSSGFDAYFEMLSPAEQAAELTRRLTKEFAILGEELPADVKAFRNLLNDTNKIDITTEAGQKLYGQIIALAPEFNDLQDALDSANSDVNALVQSLRDLAEQARAARGETEQPRNLAYTRSQFEQASVLAMQGDTKAAEKLLTLGKDLMGLSKTYSVTGSEYAKDLALIQRAATVSADIQANGLGTSISPTLTPSTNTTTTPTIATTNSTMTTELQGMREELNAGLFAIAKFVQNVDSRTERWDDGSRMMVGIQPENGDIPVPVAVVP